MYGWPQWGNNPYYNMAPNMPLAGHHVPMHQMPSQQIPQTFIIDPYNRGMQPQIYPNMSGGGGLMMPNQPRLNSVPRKRFPFTPNRMNNNGAENPASKTHTFGKDQVSGAPLVNNTVSPVQAVEISSSREEQILNASGDIINTVDMTLEEPSDPTTEMAPKNVQEQERLNSLKEQAKNWQLQQQQQIHWEQMHQAALYQQMSLQIQTNTFSQQNVQMIPGIVPQIAPQMMNAVPTLSGTQSNFAPACAPIHTSPVVLPKEVEKDSAVQSKVAETSTGVAGKAVPEREQVTGDESTKAVLLKHLREFEGHLRQWNEQFDEWRMQNRDHSDKEKYLCYERQWLDWRTQLVNRHLQMKEIYNQQVTQSKEENFESSNVKEDDYSGEEFNENGRRFQNKNYGIDTDKRTNELSAISNVTAVKDDYGRRQSEKSVCFSFAENKQQDWSYDKESEMLELARCSGYKESNDEPVSIGRKSEVKLTDKLIEIVEKERVLPGPDGKKVETAVRGVDERKANDGGEVYDPFEDDDDFRMDLDKSTKIGAIWFDDSLNDELSVAEKQSVAKRPALLETPSQKSTNVTQQPSNKKVDEFGSEQNDVRPREDVRATGSQLFEPSQRSSSDEHELDERVWKFDDDCYVIFDEKIDKSDPQFLRRVEESDDDDDNWGSKRRKANKERAASRKSDREVEPRPKYEETTSSRKENRFEPRNTRTRKSRFSQAVVEEEPAALAETRSDVFGVKKPEITSQRSEAFTRRSNLDSRFEPFDSRRDVEVKSRSEDVVEVNSWHELRTRPEYQSVKPGANQCTVDPSKVDRSTPTTPLAVGGAITRPLTEDEENIIKQATKELKILHDLKDLTKMLGPSGPNLSKVPSTGYGSGGVGYGSKAPNPLLEVKPDSVRTSNLSLLSQQPVFSVQQPVFNIEKPDENRCRSVEATEVKGKLFSSGIKLFDYDHKSSAEGAPPACVEVSTESQLSSNAFRTPGQSFRITKVQSIDYNHGQASEPTVQITDKLYEDPSRRIVQPTPPTLPPSVDSIKEVESYFDKPYISKERIVQRWEPATDEYAVRYKRSTEQMRDEKSRESKSRDGSGRSGTVLISDLIGVEGRRSRPGGIVIILRGPPGSSKTYVAKLIKDKEMENGGGAPRILSLDDYFMIETERIEKDPETGKPVKKKVMEYEYEAEAEESYRRSLFKSFKKTIDDGFFPFIILDAINNRIKHFEEMHSYAKQKGFQVYICEMDMEPYSCFKRNIHNRTSEEINKMIKNWEDTPRHYLQLDVRSLLQDASITEVEMEDFVETEVPKSGADKTRASTSVTSAASSSGCEDGGSPELEIITPSKWERMDATVERLDKLDGFLRVKRKLEAPKSLESYLQDDYEERETQPGKKRVRWADVEVLKSVKKQRELGFVVGQNWSNLTDPNYARKALTRTKYI